MLNELLFFQNLGVNTPFGAKIIVLNPPLQNTRVSAILLQKSTVPASQLPPPTVSVGQLPTVSAPQLPLVSAPQLPSVSAPQLPSVSAPQLQLPSVSAPELQKPSVSSTPAPSEKKSKLNPG